MAVYKDNNGTWYISVRYVNWKGEHARKVKRGFATKREATDWERNFLHENAGNLDMSFETFVDLYKKNLKERLKLSTWQTKVSIIDTKILPYFKKKRINDIKVSDVVAWQNTLLNMEDENGERYSLVYLKTIHTLGCFRIGDNVFGPDFLIGLVYAKNNLHVGIFILYQLGSLHNYWDSLAHAKPPASPGDNYFRHPMGEALIAPSEAAFL